MADTHPNTRFETFCDGVFAIALTLLIIDIKIPSSEVIGTSREMWLALRHLGPSIVAFDGAAGGCLDSRVWGGTGNQLTKDEKSTAAMRHNRRNGYFAFVVYSLLALVAFWFPLPIAVVTTMLWAYWLVLDIRMG